jgi:hypothetical protein
LDEIRSAPPQLILSGQSAFILITPLRGFSALPECGDGLPAPIQMCDVQVAINELGQFIRGRGVSTPPPDEESCDIVPFAALHRTSMS